MNKNKVVTSIGWKFAERCGNSGINFIVSIILARLLTPEEYGTIALVTVFITLLQVFTQSGFGNALIQKKDADELDFSTVFYFQIVFSIVLYGLLFVAAPFIADFYGDTIYISLLRVLGIKVIIVGVLNVQSARTSRNLEFKKFFYATLSGTIVSAIIGIGMAYADYGVWALVGQTLSVSLVNVIVLWLIADFRPQLIFSFQRLKGLFSYGWKLLASELLNTLYLNLRSLIIGKVYTTEDLAYYNKGASFPQLIITNLNTSINAVLMPSMARMQDNKEQLKAAARKAIRISGYLIWPCMAGLFVCANPLVELVLTEKWLPCVPFLRMFCITYAFMPIQTANMSAIKSLGRSDIFLKLNIAKKTIGVLSILLTVKYGVFAIALAGVVVTPIEAFINASPNKKLIGYSYIEQMKDFVPNILLSVVMGFCVWWIQYLSLPLIVILVLQAIAGVAIYIGLSVVLKMDSFFYVWQLVKELLGSKVKVRKKMKKIIIVISSWIVALCILNVMCMIYYNIPRHTTNQTGTTDYIWESNFVYSRGIEGFSNGITNNEGFNNLFDYEGQELDILIMGSSQMEAFNVQQDQSTASLLNDFYNEDVVYNIGVSGHDFYTIVGNVEEALSTYTPSEYLIIEIGTLNYDKELLQSVIDNTYTELASYDSGIIYELQGIPYLRLLYSQVSSYLAGTASDEIVAEDSSAQNSGGYSEELEIILSELNLLCSEYDVTPIIFYQTKLILNEDGTVTTNTDADDLELFKTACEKNNIVFVDMTETFIEGYTTDYILPHGFANTTIGTGHLNKYGHEMIANKLIQVMEELS